MPSALWIRRTVLAALPALFTRPASARPLNRQPVRPAQPVVLLIGPPELAAAWTPAVLEAGCAPLGPIDPADLADALAWVRATPQPAPVALMGPAGLLDSQPALEDLALLIRLAPDRPPLSGRAVAAAATALVNDDPLSKAHAVLLAMDDADRPARMHIPVVTLKPTDGAPQLALALDRLRTAAV